MKKKSSATPAREPIEEYICWIIMGYVLMIVLDVVLVLARWADPRMHDTVLGSTLWGVIMCFVYMWEDKQIRFLAVVFLGTMVGFCCFVLCLIAREPLAGLIIFLTMISSMITTYGLLWGPIELIQRVKRNRQTKARATA